MLMVMDAVLHMLVVGMNVDWTILQKKVLMDCIKGNGYLIHTRVTMWLLKTFRAQVISFEKYQHIICPFSKNFTQLNDAGQNL